MRVRRAITWMILEELARLKASGEGEPGDLLERAALAVAHDQYDHLSEESREYLGRGFAREMRKWTAIDWGVATGELGPPGGSL